MPKANNVRMLGIIGFIVLTLLFGSILTFSLFVFISWSIGLILTGFFIIFFISIVALWWSLTSLFKLIKNQPSVENRLKAIEDVVFDVDSEQE